MAYDFSNVPGYEEMGTYMTNKEPLYDRFDMYPYMDYIKSTDKYERQDKNKVLIKEKWKEYAENYAFLSVREITPEGKQTWKGDGNSFKRIDEMCLTVDDIDESVLSENDREIVEIIRALNHYQAYQKTNRVTMIDMKASNIDINNPGLKESLFNEIVKKLNEGVPLVLGIPTHVVNVIRIEQSLDTPNEYQMYVYNNNYPGKEYMITIEKNTRVIHRSNPFVNNQIETSYRFVDTDGTFGMGKGVEIDVEFYYANVQ